MKIAKTLFYCMQLKVNKYLFKNEKCGVSNGYYFLYPYFPLSFVLPNSLSITNIYFICLEPFLRMVTSLIIYGPEGPGGKKLSIYVTIFLERQSWCRHENEGIQILSNGNFLKWTRDLSFWRKKCQTNIFTESFDQFLERFSHPIWKHAYFGTAYLPW